MKVRSKIFDAYNAMPFQADITRAWNTRQIAAANASKIQSLSKQVYINRGELKTKHGNAVSASMPNATATTLELTLVSQGTDVFNRTGNHIYVKGFNVKGNTLQPLLDVYVVLSKNGVTPSYGDFQNSPGGFLYATQRSEFVVLATLRARGSYGGSDILLSASKRMHLASYFNGAAAGNGVRNRIYLVIKNDTGTTAAFNFNVELYFRDK